MVDVLPLIAVFLLLAQQIASDVTTSGYDDQDDREESDLDRFGPLRRRMKRWHCHGPYGSGGGGGGGFGGGGGGGYGGFGGGGGGGGFGGFGGAGGGLADLDPTTYILLALLSGAGGGMPPVGTGVGGSGGLIPLPPSVPLKSPVTEPPPVKSIEDFEPLDLPPGLKPPTVASDPDDDKKPRGHVTPGNRCQEDSECVSHAECVEALRQKYCVCAPGRRPKGGLCV